MNKYYAFQIPKFVYFDYWHSRVPMLYCIHKTEEDKTRFNEFKKMVDACGVDAILERHSDGTYALTLEDFDGFDDNWNEIEREYENEEAVDALLDWLEANCTEREDNLYIHYVFPDFQLTFGYASFDI